VDVPKILNYLNEWAMFDDLDTAAKRYNIFVKEGERASLCEGCGECEEACPQGLPIRELLAEAEAHLEEKTE
jgi:predicted aldo/keto reductase-like oxidoreductase